MIERLLEIYTVDRPTRLRIYGIVLLVTFSYGVVNTLVFGRPEDTVTLEFLSFLSVLALSFPLLYSLKTKSSGHQETAQASQQPISSGTSLPNLHIRDTTSSNSAFTTSSVEEITPASGSAESKLTQPAMARSGQAFIGRSIIVNGEISGSEDLYVEGAVRGAIEVHDHRLTVGPNGQVDANVVAREIVIHGTLNGNVLAKDEIEIRKTARMLGDITTARIMIEDGAYFKGTIDILMLDQKASKPWRSSAEPTRSSPEPTPKPVAQVSPRFK